MTSQHLLEANPGAIEVKEITIESLIYKDKKRDIRPIVIEMNTFEGIHMPFLRAHFVIEDSVSLLSQFPIVGEELIHVEFKTPVNSFLKSYKHTFRIYAVEELQPMKERTATYIIKAISREALKDSLATVKKSYSGMTIKEMAEKVFEEYLLVDKKIEASETEATRTFAIPNLTPANTLRFLAREAKSPSFEPSNFIFYETVDGFYFKTIEEILSKRPQDKYYSTAKQIDEGNVSGPSRSSAQKQTKPFEFRKLSDIRYIRVFDDLMMLKKGGFSNKLFYINPVMNTFNETRFDYNNDLNKFNWTTKGKIGRFVTDNSEYVNGDGTNHQIYITTNSGIQGNPEFIDLKPEFLHYVVGSVALLDNLVANITIPGDSSRRAGDIIRIEIPEFSAAADVEGKTHRLLSGSYLVTSVRHTYAQSQPYYTVMQVVKNAYEADPDDLIETANNR